MSRNDYHLLTFVVRANYFCECFWSLKRYLKRCRISRAFRKYKNYFGIAWFRVGRGKILKNWHNNQVAFLAVYRQYESLKAIVEITELANFVEKTFLHLLRRLRTRTDQRTQRKVKNSRGTLKNRFFDPVSRVVSLVCFGIFQR